MRAEYHDKIRILEPLGLIYEEKVHLIAREPQKGESEYNYVLHKLKNVKLTNETFDSKDFNLQEYSQKSFGVYFGEIYDVKLKFIPEAAEDVMNYNFHPTQKINLQDDGSVIVTFKASCDKHIIDKRNSKAKVYIGGKYLFIRQENQDNAYFIEL